MLECKNCKSSKIVKNGVVRGKQRYYCKECGYNFVDGDDRTNDKLAAKKALAVILYSLGKASFNMLGHIFGVSRSLVYRWIVEAGSKLPETEISGTITQMEFDEMWHFVKSKKTNFGLSKQLIVAQGELWHGCSVIVILQPSSDSTTK